MTIARLAAAGIVALAAIASLPVHAASGTFPVIVVLSEQASLTEFGPGYRPDVRAARNAFAWDYLRPEVAGAVQALERSHGFVADHVYSHALRGFAARLTARQILDLEGDPLVALVEADGIMEAGERPGGKPGKGGGSDPVQAQELPWGIDRVDADQSTTLAGNGEGAVGGVDVYVIDTGIDPSHPDLVVAGSVNFAGGKDGDCNGHGTHVAGTIAAVDNTRDVVGVAPGASLYAVKVLGCSGSGSTSGVIKGIDWVTATADGKSGTPAVANMSLGGGASEALDMAVARSVGSGIFYALAAGNESTNACIRSPARVGKDLAGAITVGATDASDAIAWFSNVGACVEVFAPGVSIVSTRKGGGTTTMSGTSMAAPHAAGAATLYRSLWRGDTAADTEAAISSAAQQDMALTGAAVPIVDVGSW